MYPGALPAALWPDWLPQPFGGGHLHAPLLYHCVGTTSTSSELSKQTTEYIVAGLLHENKNQTHWEIMHSNSHNLSSKSQLQTSEPAGGREKVSACEKPSPALHFLWQAITCTPEHLHGRKSLSERSWEQRKSSSKQLKQRKTLSSWSKHWRRNW